MNRESKMLNLRQYVGSLKLDSQEALLMLQTIGAYLTDGPAAKDVKNYIVDACCEIEVAIEEAQAEEEAERNGPAYDYPRLDTAMGQPRSVWGGE